MTTKVNPTSIQKNSSTKGSTWRRWDLHVHTPGTQLSNNYKSDDEASWKKFIRKLEESPVQVFGITDYFCSDNYFKLIAKYKAQFPDSNKVFFLNVELRLSDAISKTDTNPHLHIIFDNDVEICSQDKVNKFLQALKTQGQDENGSRVSCLELRTSGDYMSASVSFEDVKSALNDVFGETKPYLLAFPAKNDGVRSTDMKSPRKVLITDKIDKSCDLFFGNSDSTEHFLKVDRYQKGKSEAKPVVSGSDAHSFEDLERLEGNVANFEPTWIKGDPTFRGLRQICYEPVSRVFIGDEPTIEKRKKLQATKIIKSVSITQNTGYDEINGEWFKNVELELNPELTAIIGNKGSGKSALVDILGLLGESKLESHFSFLTDDRNNKKFRRRGYAENFSATCVWEDSTKVSKRLSDYVDTNKPELVRYLPQNYFEQLTNEIEIQQFRKEIEEVVFSHVSQADRMLKSSFQELEEFKTQQSKQNTSAKKASLRELNFEIVRLEEQADPDHREKIENELAKKKAELDSILKQKPIVVEKPSEATEEQKQQSSEIEVHTSILEKLKRKEESLTEKYSDAKYKLERLTLLLEAVLSLKGEVQGKIESLALEFIDLKIDIKSIFKFKTDTSLIDEDISKIKKQIFTLDQDNNVALENEFIVDALTSRTDLKKYFDYHSEQVRIKKQLLSTPQRKYQAYLEALQIWEESKNGIIGSDTDPKSGTIKFLESKISYIDTEVSLELNDLKSKRKSILLEIFESKKEVLKFYSNLKSSVDAKLEVVKTDDFSVEIEAAFVLNQNFIDEFLSKINKTKRGTFYGTNNPTKILSNLISEINWNNLEDIVKFTDDVLNLLSNYDGENLSISSQVMNVKEFYDYLFSLDFISTKYELRLGGKNLNELSPGEKGLLLLIFYLQLDKDNIPLLIDQPEDNLDNDSIYAVLAQCIRQAKKHRQVILVTHNPNLAVGADAEQIIYVKLEKSNNYKFSYETGAIENPNINQKIIDILEGSQPAFVKRRLKYQIK